MAYSVFDCARRFVAAFAENRFLQAFADATCQRQFLLRLGDNMQHLPTDQDAPFLIVFPDSSDGGPQDESHLHELGVVLGLSADGFAQNGASHELCGLQRLEAAAPLVEAAIRGALPGVLIKHYKIDFVADNAPLFLALISVTVEERLPVGRR